MNRAPICLTATICFRSCRPLVRNASIARGSRTAPRAGTAPAVLGIKRRSFLIPSLVR